MTTRAELGYGQRVVVNDSRFPGVWLIKNFGPKNATLEPEGGGRGLRAPYYLLSPAPTDGSGITVTAVPLQEYFAAGELVRINDGRFAGIYVVIKDSGDRVNVAKLGGDGGRYVRAYKRGVSRVDTAEVIREGVAL